MGLDTEVVKMLMRCRNHGVQFSSTLTLGKQSFFPSIKETQTIFKKFGFNPDQGTQIAESKPSSDPFWTFLGAEKLDCMDASSYEGANLIHDLNQPLPDSFANTKYSTVCDIGTLEHVFHFPNALHSVLNLVDINGHFLSFTTMNNYSGHGFYQFSPELFWQVLNETNGFQIESMIAMEYGPRFHWFEVRNPEQLGKRINLVNSYRVLLFTQARRVSNKPILSKCPQQSDYSEVWKDGSQANEKAGVKNVSQSDQKSHWSLEFCPNLIRSIEALFYSGKNSQYYFRNKAAFKKIKNKYQ